MIKIEVAGFIFGYQKQRALLEGGSDRSDNSGEKRSVDFSRFVIGLRSSPAAQGKGARVKLQYSILLPRLASSDGILTTPSWPFLVVCKSGVRLLYI